MTPQDLTDNLKSHLPTIASWAGRLAFGGIVAYSLSPLWNAATNEAALAAVGSLAGQLIPNLLSDGITRIYDRLRSAGKTPTPEELAQAIEDEAKVSEAFRIAMLDYVEKLLYLNRHIFREVQMTHESVVEMWDRLGEELKHLGAAETESAKKIEVMRDEVLVGLGRVETKVDAVKDDTKAMRTLVEEIHHWLSTTTSNKQETFRLLTPDWIEQQSSSPHLWDYPTYPKWGHFSADPDKAEDIKRAISDEIFTQLTSSTSGGLTYLQLVLAPSGYGKTSMLMRLAADLCRSGYLVLWLAEEGGIKDAVEAGAFVRQLAQKLGHGKRLFLFIDNIMTIPNVVSFMQELNLRDGKQSEVFVIGTSQHRDAYEFHELSKGTDIHALLDTPLTDLELGLLTDEELHNLVSLLHKHQKLDSRIPSPNQIEPHLAAESIAIALNRASSGTLTGYQSLYEPRQAVSFLTQGRPLEQAVGEKLRTLQGSDDYIKPGLRNELVSIYGDICLTYRMGVSMPYDWLVAVEADNVDRSHSVEHLADVYNDKLRAVVIVGDDKKLRAYHELDAQFVCKRLFQPKELLNGYIRLINAAPTTAREPAFYVIAGLFFAAQAEFDIDINFGRTVLAACADKIAWLTENASCRELTMWGYLYDQVYDKMQAIRFVELAVTHDGTDEERFTAYKDLGTMYSRVGYFGEAVDAFSHAIKLNPSDPKIYIGRAAAQAALRRHKEAVDDIAQAFDYNLVGSVLSADREIAPHYACACVMIANDYLAQKSCKWVRHWLEQAAYVHGKTLIQILNSDQGQIFGECIDRDNLARLIGDAEYYVSTTMPSDYEIDSDVVNELWQQSHR